MSPAWSTCWWSENLVKENMHNLWNNKRTAWYNGPCVVGTMTGTKRIIIWIITGYFPIVASSQGYILRWNRNVKQDQQKEKHVWVYYSQIRWGNQGQILKMHSERDAIFKNGGAWLKEELKTLKNTVSRRARGQHLWHVGQLCMPWLVKFEYIWKRRL